MWAGMLVLDFFLYMLLGLYFDRVWPSDFGTAQKWYFCFSPSFWRGAKDSGKAAGIQGRCIW